MKKIKIMLLSLTLLAVVGGALAFKAKFITPACTTTTAGAGANPVCPTPLAVEFDPNVIKIYTTTPNAGTCSYKVQGVDLPLTCFNSTSSTAD